MLRASIIGHLGGDPEVRYTQKGEQLVTVSVAVNQRKRNPDNDEWTESTNWFRIRCNGWRAELAQKLSKGQRVYVCGRLEINEYERRGGGTGISYDVWADELHGMGAPKTESSNGAAPARSSAAGAAAASGADLEDLPF